jgi:hypothetical protein
MGHQIKETTKMFVGDAIERAEDVVRALKEVEEGKYDTEFTRARMDVTVLRAELVVSYIYKAIQYEFPES